MCYMRRLFNSKESCANWILFITLALLVLVKCCLGHYYMQHSILVSSLWKHPLYFWAFYMPKIAIAILIGSSVFFIRRKWWLILISLFVDFWIWANVVYFRVYGGVIDGYVLMMTGNLNGFESAILALIETKDFILFLLTAIYAAIIFFLRHWQKRDWKTGLIVFCVSCLIWAFASNLNYIRYQMFLKQSVEHYVAPAVVFYAPFSQTTRSCVAGTAPCYDFSVLHMLFFAVDDIMQQTVFAEKAPEITEDDHIMIRSLQGKQDQKKNDNRIILTLFESLEDWVVQPEFMPNTYRLINSGHSLHAHKIAKQAMAGGSADGQMIVNTGLLPIDRGAVCFSYPFNTFPSLPKQKAVTLLPHPIDAWNQKYMSPAYGYDTTIVTTEQEAFCQTASLLQKDYDFAQIVTMTSHEPFGCGAEANIQLSSQMPSMMANYIRCVNVTDGYIGQMLDSLHRYQLLDSITIVITGDHTIFHKERRDAFVSYCIDHDLHYGVEDEYCPLVIYSPALEGESVCDAEAYQMDVYPTILGVLGYEDYYWKGFGVDLTDSAQYSHRAMDEKEAYRLSNLLIRNDYFKGGNK